MRENINASRPIPKAPVRHSIFDRGRGIAGSIAIILAIILPILIGFGALSTDVAQWYWEQRNLQSTADAAAAAGALEIWYTSNTQAERRAREDATRNDIGASAIVTATSPPESGPYDGNTMCVSVTIRKPMTLNLARLVGLESVTVTAYSTAMVEMADEHCVLALDPSQAGAVTVTGAGNVYMDCGVASNSSSSSSLTLGSGSAIMGVSSVAVRGGIENKGTLTVTGTTRTEHPPFEDPYADTEMPPVTGCDHTKLTTQPNTNTTLTQGTYCNGMSLKGNVTLAPGTYVIDGGDLDISADAVVRGQGVTIILTGDSPAKVGQINKINGGADVELSAPSSGPYAGMLLIQDPAAESCEKSTCNQMNGGADMNLQGAIYFPKQTLSFSGNSSIDSFNPDEGCLQIVARQVIFNGDSRLANKCSTAGTESISSPRAFIVE